jgi:predicted MFS family arabinose efflux permease
LASAATTLGFLAVLRRLPIRDEPRGTPGRMLARIAEGLRFVRSRPVILGSISLDMAAVLLGGAAYLLPIFARDILTTRPFGMSPEQSLGCLRAAPALGAFAMAMILTHRRPVQRAGRALFLSVAAFGAATVVFGVSRHFWLSFAMLFLTGFFDNVSVVVRHTLIQLRTPNAMRGRVSAVNSIFIGSSNELGGFESGLVAQFFGPVISVVSGGIGTLACVAIWASRFPDLRRFGRITAEEPPEPAGDGA